MKLELRPNRGREVAGRHLGEALLGDSAWPCVPSRSLWRSPQRSDCETMTNLTATSGGNIGAKLMASGELLLKQLRTAA